MKPVLHLSLPVRDLTEARAFYVDVFRCPLGRVQDGWLDVWFYGMQLTLQEQPTQLLTDDQRGVRHFGVTLSGEQLDALVQRLRAHAVRWVHEVTIDFAGTPQEQAKAKVLDPSGNVIELKAYAHPDAALGPMDMPS